MGVLIWGLTIFPMQLRDFESVLAIQNNVVIGFVPPCDCCKLWSGEPGERVEIQSIDGKAQ